MPPIGYPGNSISKEARAKAGGGFESAIEAISESPAFSYFENFEGLVKDASWAQAYNASITNANPIIFPGGVQIVSLDDPIQGMAETPPLAPVNPKISAANPSSGRTGGGVNCALRFNYNGTLLTDPYSDALVELRFEMNPDFLSGASGLAEIWIQYDEYIPANYFHRNGADAVGDGSAGRKELSLYADTYSDQGGTYSPTFILGVQPKILAGDTEPSSIMDLDFKFPLSADPTTSYSRRYGTRTGVAAADLVLIDPVLDPGHWQRRTLHVKMSSSSTATDGAMELWVQRQAETAAPPAPEKLGNYQGNLYGRDQNYLNKGYLLGYSNDGFTEDTTFLVDNLIIANSFDAIDASAADIGV